MQALAHNVFGRRAAVLLRLNLTGERSPDQLLLSSPLPTHMVLYMQFVCGMVG